MNRFTSIINPMKIDANTIEELIEGSGERRALLEKMDQHISSALPELERVLFKGPSITMIGYGPMPWKRSKSSGEWPLISIAPQKHNISIYVAADKSGVPLPQLYNGKLGKVSLGKNCIRLTEWKNLDHENFTSLLKDSLEWFHSGQNHYGRNCAEEV